MIAVDEISDVIARRIAARDLDLDTSGVDALLVRAKGWPLLLRLLNRAAHAKTQGPERIPAREAVKSVVSEYDQTGPASFDPSDADDRRRAVAASVGIGIRQLSNRQVTGIGDLAAAYRLLGVFPADTRIPLDVLQQLYSAVGRSGISLPAVHRACQILHEQSLVQRFAPDSGWIELHDEIREHLRRAFSDELIEAHRMLLEAVRPADGWGSLPEHPAYWWRDLAWHLVEVGHIGELTDTMLDPNYLLGKVCRTGPIAVEAELRQAQTTDQVHALDRMLRQDGFCLAGFETAVQAAPTFAARLAGTPLLAGLRLGIEAVASTPWLRPERGPLDFPSPALWRTLAGHQDRVWSVAWSSEDTRLASAGWDGTVRIWDVGDLDAEPVVLTGHQGPVESVAWSSEGTRLASAGRDRRVRIWDGGDLDAEPVVLTGHQGPVESVAWSSEDTWLASAGEDGTVRLWSPVGQEVSRLAGAATLVSIAWHPHLDRLVVACSAGWWILHVK